MKSETSLNRWFWIHVGMMMMAGSIALITWEQPSEAAEQYAAIEGVDLPAQFPIAMPMGFAGFDQDVPLGHEAEALEALLTVEPDCDSE